MFTKNSTAVQARSSILSTHPVLRNTYLLLGLTLLFSSGMTWFAIATNAQPLGVIPMLIGMFGLLFLTQALSNSPLGLLSVFAFTGFMGYTLGPVINMYLTMFSNGGQIVMTALGATGIIFFALSAYVLSTGKNFTYMGGFLCVGLIAVIVGSVASIWIPALDIIVAMASALIFSGFIMYETSNIVQGGQNNYILATISLYISILNLFMSLLRLLAMFAGNRN